MIPRIPIDPGALRVFHGFMKAGLDESEFLRLLGEVFMPGTPLMLRELGLAAYLPAVVPRVEGVDGLPDEVAIIAYASPERYAHARNETVVGRMYTYTHLAVFDMERSRSQFPQALARPTGAISAFWCTGEPSDWQADGDVIVWIGHAASASFPADFVGALAERVPAARRAGMRECVGQVGATWASLWLLMDGFERSAAGVADEIAAVLRPPPGGATELVLERATRLVWREQLPPVPVVRGGAWSFVFSRELGQFLAP